MTFTLRLSGKEIVVHYANRNGETMITWKPYPDSQIEKTQWFPTENLLQMIRGETLTQQETRNLGEALGYCEAGTEHTNPPRSIPDSLLKPLTVGSLYKPPRWPNETK